MTKPHEKEKCTCPCCGADITDFMHSAVIRYNRRRQMEAAARKITPEQREKLNRAGAERFRKWREENPEKAVSHAMTASRARTAESFARQAKTVKNTMIRTSVKFAELLFEAKAAGREITPEVEAELMRRARDIIKEDNRAAKRDKRKAGKPSA